MRVVLLAGQLARLLWTSRLRMLSGVSVRGMSRRRRAVTRVAGDRVTISVGRISLTRSVLLTLPVDEGLTVGGSRSCLVITVGLQRHSVGRVLLVLLRDVARLCPGSCATVPISCSCVRCRWVTAGMISPANGRLAVSRMLNVARSRVIPGSWILTSLLLGTVVKDAAVLRVVAGGLTVRGLRSLDRKNAEHQQRYHSRSGNRVKEGTAD